MNNSTLVIIALVGVLLLSMFVIPHYLLKRAVRQVVRVFREYNATDARNARNLVELGLKPRGILEGLMRGRDYKQYALDLLRRLDVVRMTEDGRLYLSEDKLAASNLGILRSAQNTIQK